MLEKLINFSRMPEKKQKLIIIDAPAVLHRAWHALPKLTDPKGRIINAVYGFTVLLLKLIREQKPDYIAVAFDTKAPTFRHKKYKEYKATRVPQPQEFYDQIPITKQVIQSFDIPVFARDGFEADDLIGTIVNNLKSKSIIVSGDLDLLQLVDDKTEVYFLKQGVANIKTYNRDTVYQRYDLLPDQLIDFKALVGDPSDNIKGVPGIGPKTALDLIKKFKNIENIYQHLALTFYSKKIKEKGKCKIKGSTARILIKHKKNALLAKELVTIKKQIKGLDLKKIKQVKTFDPEKIVKIFQKLGFHSLIKRIEKVGLQEQSKLF